MKLLVALLCLVPVICNAGAGMPCKQYEYAQLKDSSKAELTDLYCAALKRDEWNSDNLAEAQKQAAGLIGEGAGAGALSATMSDYTAARKTCQAASGAAWGMLEKKYKIRQPSCK